MSNIVGPNMLYFGRFVIGALMTMTAVAYYTTPYEVVVNLAIVPDALGRGASELTRPRDLPRGGAASVRGFCLAFHARVGRT